MTPKQLIDSLFITELKRRLIYTNDRIQVIGEEMGFDENTNFVKFFKKRVGKSPKKFRVQFEGFL